VDKAHKADKALSRRQELAAPPAARDHPAGDLALSSFHPELAQRLAFAVRLAAAATVLRVQFLIFGWPCLSYPRRRALAAQAHFPLSEKSGVKARGHMRRESLELLPFLKGRYAHKIRSLRAYMSMYP
jgi:hypothetical protein